MPSTSRSFLTALLSALPIDSDPQRSSDASPNNTLFSALTKPIFLTLHALYPTILLPALDLLDRRLITRLILLSDSTHGASEQNDDGSAPHERRRAIYYVKSNAHRDGRSRYSRGGDLGSSSNEVTTRAWSCTCPAFVYSAFSNAGPPPSYGKDDDYVDTGRNNAQVEETLDLPQHEEGDTELETWQWGGIMSIEEAVPPLCKHLLACVLAEQWGVAVDLIEEKAIGMEEMAGWAAGWGG